MYWQFQKMKRRNCVRISLVVVGVILITFGLVLGYAIFPPLVEKLVREELDIWNVKSEGSINFVSFYIKLFTLITLSSWILNQSHFQFLLQNEPPVPIYMKFYFFDVQNPKAFTEGTEKASLVEKGPYTYREIRKKVNHSSFFESECYVKAGQYKAYIFDHEMSCEGEWYFWKHEMREAYQKWNFNNF